MTQIHPRTARFPQLEAYRDGTSPPKLTDQAPIRLICWMAVPTIEVVSNGIRAPGIQSAEHQSQ